MILSLELSFCLCYVDDVNVKEMTVNLKIFSQVDCFNLCDVLRLHLSTYSDTLNAHVMHDGSGDLFGCICSN